MQAGAAGSVALPEECGPSQDRQRATWLETEAAGWGRAAALPWAPQVGGEREAVGAGTHLVQRRSLRGRRLWGGRGWRREAWGLAWGLAWGPAANHDCTAG